MLRLFDGACLIMGNFELPIHSSRRRLAVRYGSPTRSDQDQTDVYVLTWYLPPVAGLLQMSLTLSEYFETPAASIPPSLPRLCLATPPVITLARKSCLCQLLSSVRTPSIAVPENALSGLEKL
ncbi:hypothetical protein ABW21_db0200130 [Orbilia brochopaga]|nr:hypothetical protein ABW21_db0200130 [Drechslerella brochopaga]